MVMHQHRLRGGGGGNGGGGSGATEGDRNMRVEQGYGVIDAVTNETHLSVLRM